MRSPLAPEVVPARERTVSLGKHLGDVRALTTLPQLAAHGGAGLGGELTSDRSLARDVRPRVSGVHSRRQRDCREQDGD